MGVMSTPRVVRGMPEYGIYPDRTNFDVWQRHMNREADAITQVVNTLHNGKNRGPDPVRLVVFTPELMERPTLSRPVSISPKTGCRFDDVRARLRVGRQTPCRHPALPCIQ